MEEIVTLESLFEGIEIPEYKFYASFNPETGEIVSVGPAPAFNNNPNKIEIDQEIAESIIEGKIRMSSCFVDLSSDTLEIVETRPSFKIDDVLHRIPNIKWANLDKFDIYITHSKRTNTLKFQLSEEYLGTKKLSKKFQPVKPKRIKWDGETVIDFLVTEYNDPNVIYFSVSFKIEDLIGKTKIVKNLNLPDDFSVYTRRIFKNYVIDLK
jgi:hypothetical protein